MKKGLKLFATGFVAMSALALHVNADEVTDYESLNSCVSKTGNTCTLKNDVEISETINVTNGVEVTIDLNGNDITAKTDTVDPLFSVNNGSLDVTGKGTITSSKDTFSLLGNTVTGGEAIKAELEIGSNVEVVSNTSNCVYLKGKGAKLDVYGNLLSKSEKYATIQGNGSFDATNDSGNTVINIYDGASVVSENNLAIYHPQSGTLTVNGGTIEGTTGIEMRAGNLVVKGGTIRGTYIPTEFDSNGNGSTTEGAGIAIAQHTTKQAIDVKVSGGTIEGYTALHEVNTEKSTIEELAKITMKVTGGNFNALNKGPKAVYSQNKTAFITGGEFNTSVDSTYLVSSTEESDAKTDVYEVITQEGEIQYVVTDETKVKEGYFGLGFTKEGFEEVFNDQEEYDEVMGLIEETLAKKYTAAIYYELVYGDLVNDSFVLGTEVTDKLEKAIEVTLEVPTTLEKVKEGYTRKYSVIRVHENKDGKYETTILPAKEKDGKVTFETDRFSTYVLAYEDVKDTKNPDTGDNMLVYFATAVMSVIGLALTTLRITKKQK